MPETHLAVATRVQVRRDVEFGPGPWPDEPIGTIITSPLDGTPFTSVATARGPELQYWVAFDEPQRDGDGDGPYASGQVLARYIERLL